MVGGLSKPSAGRIPSDAPLLAYQAYIRELEQDRGWDTQGPERNCFLLGEEVGELFGAVRRYAPGTQGATEAVGDELVDVFNFLLALANRYDLDLSAAFREKNTRNEGRIWPEGSPGTRSG